ncbi:MAG: hypothetical protein K2K67_02405 [Treponemataceae bacterium]|nr:hypothetical protein [Treponemataceae bacterium]
MRRLAHTAAFFAAVILLFASCASTRVDDGQQDNFVSEQTDSAKKQKTKKPKVKKKKFTQEAFDKAYADGDYASCVAMLNGKKHGKDKILDALDANMLMHLNAQYLDSARAFMDTQREMQQSANDTSGGKSFAATVAGENSTAYAGTVYERLLAYSMRAVNALALGDISNAKGVMDTYAGDYKDVIAPLVAQEKALEAESENALETDDVSSALKSLRAVGVSVDLGGVNGGRPAKYTGKPYENSAFLSYLGALIYAANNAPDHAQDSARLLRETNPNISVSEDIAIPAEKGRLTVVALSGTIGKRSQGAQEFSTGLIPVLNTPLKFKIAYPVFLAQDHAISAVRVTLSDGTAKTATLIEDFDDAVKIDVAKKARGAYNRSVFRNITKNAATATVSITALIAADKAVKRSQGSVMMQLATQATYAATVAGLNAGLNAIINAEKADVRQGSYFPHKASAAGFTVNPGTYSVKVEYLSKDGTVIETKEQGDISVVAGKPTVVVSSCGK